MKRTIRFMLRYVLLPLMILAAIPTVMLIQDGYELYAQALEECPVQEMAERIESKPDYTPVDELPQIYNILAGQMSIIGPRPALYNQYDLIDARDKVHANDIRPGLTGLAQINGRDELPIDVKAKYDGEYAAHLTFGMDLKIFFHSFSYVFQRRGVVEGGTGSIQEPNEQKPSN